jgi:hypothetical protein
MIFTQKIKRFLEPIIDDKKVYIQSGFEGIMDGLYLISGLYFFEKIGYSIQQLSTVDFKMYLITYGIISLIYFTIKVFVIHW